MLNLTVVYGGTMIADEAKLSAPTSDAGKLQRLCLAQIRQHEAEGTLPTNIRFVYYELKDRLPARKTVRTWAQCISEAFMHLRESGIVPWDWLTDETRQLTNWRTAPSVYEYALNSIGRARIDLWNGTAPLIICESQSLAGVLDDLAQEYAVPIFASRGQVNGALHSEVLPALTLDRVAYLGDLNNAGADIEANTRRVLEREAGPLDWERVLLTDEQVRKHKLPAKETTDARYRNGGRVSDSWEAEALGQPRIQRLLRAWLDKQLPEPIERVRVREQRQRREVTRALKRFTGRVH